jgi:GT2 family glycosyltransferase
MIPVMIVPVLTRPELLYRLVSTIDHPVGHLLIIDNGDVVGDPPAALANVEKVSVIRLPSNVGVAAAWNWGIKLTPHAPWWMIVNFDVTFPEGALERFAAIQTGGLVLSAAAPPWSCFAVHDETVAHVGLFDEAFYPAYWEDIDYERRVRAAGIPVTQTDIHVHHDNSSTITSIPNRNAETFAANQRHYHDKVQRGDLTAGSWSLQRRREQAWD